MHSNPDHANKLVPIINGDEMDYLGRKAPALHGPQRAGKRKAIKTAFARRVRRKNQAVIKEELP